jgi:hypothetical protein
MGAYGYVLAPFGLRAAVLTYGLFLVPRCLVSASITDIFFLHEQGTRLAIWQLGFNGSVCMAPIISGVLIQKLGRFVTWSVIPIRPLGLTFTAFVIQCSCLLDFVCHDGGCFGHQYRFPSGVLV